jgi:hypothetical protein
MDKDWVGNYNSIYKTLGASNHSEGDREINDFYATDPKAIDLLLEKERFATDIWECACGAGHLSMRLENLGHNVKSTDLIDRGFGESGVDFLRQTEKWNGDIITNPPYKYALDFIKKSLELVNDGNKVSMFLKLQFLEGKERRKFYNEKPPKVVYVASGRLKCAINGNFDGLSSAVAYAWFVWEKGYKGEPVIRWIN